MDYSKKPGQKIDKFGTVINKNEKPTISIITPFYNGGKTLMETANAVFNQTYPYFEWIIVDDGSKDESSLKKLSELEKMDPRIKVFHKENGGPSVARDFGISQANKDTKYIFFLDCDDIPDKTMIECLYWTLETHKDASFAYTKMVNFGDKEFLWERYLTVEQQKIENLICISSMIRKEDLLEVGCFGIKEKSMYEDWNLWLKLLEKGKKPIRVNAPLFWYRVSNTGEFSRAKKNNENAMRYVNETASKIKEDVEIIQFPREGHNYAKVKDYNMTLPKYEKEKKKRILFIFPWMVIGGADLFNLELIKRLDPNKYESIVLTTTPNENVLRQEFEEYAKEVYDMATFLERDAYLNFTDYIIESRNIDAVVISNTQYGYYMVPYLKGKYPQIPFIDYIHSIDLKDPREGFGRCTKDVDKYLSGTYCCNNFTKNQLEKNYNKKNVQTIYIGTDEEKFNPKKYNKDSLKEKYNIPKDKLIVTFIARLSDEKRPLMFVEIAKKVLEAKDNVFFVIAGDGPLANKVAGKINSNFKMLGMIKESEEIYAISDITVNCSSLEGLALTSYESLSMGVPVVSTDVGGQKELIDNTVGGIVHYNEFASKEEYNNEINQYKDEIIRVIDNLNKLKKNCRKKIEEGFTLNQMTKKISSIIEKSIEEEKNTSSIANDYLEYELAIESLYKSYYFHCKTYIETKFDIYYDENHQTRSKGRFYPQRVRISNLLNRCHGKKDAKIIKEFLKQLFVLAKTFLRVIKYFILSIPAGIKLLYKLIMRNHMN